MGATRHSRVQSQHKPDGKLPEKLSPAKFRQIPFPVAKAPEVSIRQGVGLRRLAGSKSLPPSSFFCPSLAKQSHASAKEGRLVLWPGRYGADHG